LYFLCHASEPNFGLRADFAVLDFCEVDRELEDFERRRFFFPPDRAVEEREPFVFRRARPPPAEPLERRHRAHGSTGLYIRGPQDGFTGGDDCNRSIALKELSSAGGVTAVGVSSISSWSSGAARNPARPMVFQITP
jgi:hypothetical protein